MSKLEVVLSVVKEGFQNFKEAQLAVDDLSLKIGPKGLAGAASGFGKAMGAAGIAVGAALGAMAAGYAAVIKPALDMADALQKQADTTGLSTTALQEYAYAAKQSGSSSEAFTNATTKLNENVYKASEGNKELLKTFNNLGISLKDQNGNLRNTNEIVDETYNKLADIKDPTEQAALAIQLLGKGGKDPYVAWRF